MAISMQEVSEKPAKMQQKNVSLTVAEIQELERLAEEDCRSFSSMARMAMIEGMKVLKKKR